MRRQNVLQTFRQGDVLLERIAALPAEATLCRVDGDVILAYGEVTGHAHRLAVGTTQPYAKGGVWSPTAERFIRALPGASLTHEEHTAIAIPEGFYRVTQQVEYTAGAMRRVAD